jgi:chaperone BCS1
MDLHVEFKLASKYQARELFKCFYMPIEGPQNVGEKAEGVQDSGYATPATEKLVDVDLPAEEKAAFVGYSHQRKAPKLSIAQVVDLAQQFADVIPERELSMATLQGYLMAYKVRPFDAVLCADKWIADQKKLKIKAEAVVEKRDEEMGP